MALQNSGAISARDINLELEKSASALFNLGGVAERELAGVASGPISFANFYGKSKPTGSITAGATFGNEGWFSALLIGSITTPTINIGGTDWDITAIATNTGDNQILRLEGTNINTTLVSSSIVSLEIAGTVYTSAAVEAFTTGSGYVAWQWDQNPELTEGVTYPFTIKL